MLNQKPDNPPAHEPRSDAQPGESAGRILKKIFRQDDRVGKIEPQTASVSLLMKPLRLLIFTHLCRNPCDHTRSIARKMEMSTSSINWNLGQLLAGGYIESRGMDGRNIYWPKGMMEAEDLALAGMFRFQWPAKILKIIHGSGNSIRQKDIVSSVGLRQQNVEFWLRKMVFVGILGKKKIDKHVVYFITGKFREKVRHYESRSKDFSRIVFGILKKDGLMPKSQRLRGSRFSVDIKLPKGIKRIHLECNPLALANRFLDQ
ncbi:MAG: hypothetical protein KKH41_03905 [Candidatus Thermoplasmatota archaeon]|nr:hypothetical protein [Euryarchaeota archaeon]MBU4031756.1 hypothetical protein [Candidatus Thermoplasmatota archaeon]MBU4070905.1 hypothetical protein [Candidatus Thermoplasmatota archaeon]MBU4144956.1 hypothetical protein [Candidatus Thermoplasmatota archaeon]MBU4591711.1 hypothetical protein [Candidatus Thermoplasmatota archaeon]